MIKKGFLYLEIIFQKFFLENLCNVNPQFKWRYEIGRIQAPDVYFEKPGAQVLFKEKMIAQGKVHSQFKPVHIIRTSEEKEFFFSLREF